MRAHDAERDGEKVRAERAADVQVRPVPMQNEEDLLREILDLTGARAQSLQSLEEIIELPLVDGEAADLELGLGKGSPGGGMDLPKIAHG